MDTPTVSLGSMFDLFSADPAWMRKIGTVGACTLIPLVGIFQTLGYGKRCYQHVQAGKIPTFPNPPSARTSARASRPGSSPS